MLFFDKDSYPCEACGKDYPIPGLCNLCYALRPEHPGYKVMFEGKLVGHCTTIEAARAVIRLMRL